MSKFFLILSAFALIVSVTVCVSHSAHASVDSDTEISISIDADGSSDNKLGSNGCDMLCGGCCVHHAMNTSFGVKDFAVFGKDQMSLPNTSLIVLDLIYGLKRPPKA